MFQFLWETLGPKIFEILTFDDFPLSSFPASLLLLYEDYFIVGYYNAEQFLTKSNGSVFRAIESVRDYELDHFGEVTTDFSNSEEVANMYAYVKGEELLSECKTLRDFDGNITDEELTELLIELTEFL